jgi:hypothetical protein
MKASSQTQKDDHRSSLNLTECKKHWLLKRESQTTRLRIPSLEDFFILKFPELPSRYQNCFCEERNGMRWPSLHESVHQWQRNIPGICIFDQQCCAKGQSKNRCSIVSGSPMLHITQVGLSSMFRCLRWSIVFVFNWSTSTLSVPIYLSVVGALDPVTKASGK